MSNFKDLAIGTVLTAPSPATSGTTIVLASGHGARFPSVFPFPVTAAPSNQLPSLSNSEFLMVTNRVSDTLTVVRAQAHGLTTSTAQSITAGWIISNAIYSDDLFTSSINSATTLTGTPNGVLTTFTIATPPTMAWVFKNGVFMQPGAGNDYTLSGNTFTFSTAPASGSKLVAIPIVGNQVMISGSSAPLTGQTPAGLVNGVNTTFVVPGGTYVGGTLEVKINGIDQKRTVHYTETTPGTGTFTMSDAPLTGDDIMVDYLVVNSVFGNAASVGGYIATASPTANSIPVLDSNATLVQSALQTTVLGYAQITSAFSTTSTSAVQVTGLTSTVTIPAGGRRVRVTVNGDSMDNGTSGSYVQVSIWEGTVGSVTQLAASAAQMAVGGQTSILNRSHIYTPSAGSKTYNIGLNIVTSGTSSIRAFANSPAYILVELL